MFWSFCLTNKFLSFKKPLVSFFFFFFPSTILGSQPPPPSFLEQPEVSRMRSWDKSLVETCQINNSSCSTSKFWGCSSLVSFDVAEHRKLPPSLFSLPQCRDPVPRLTLIHPRLVKLLTLLIWPRYLRAALVFLHLPAASSR